VLARLIEWNSIERVVYDAAVGSGPRRPPLRSRLMVGLLYLQPTFDLSRTVPVMFYR
jgi:hypothetical protein